MLGMATSGAHRIRAASTASAIRRTQIEPLDTMLSTAGAFWGLYTIASRFSMASPKR